MVSSPSLNIVTRMRATYSAPYIFDVTSCPLFSGSVPLPRSETSRFHLTGNWSHADTVVDGAVNRLWGSIPPTPERVVDRTRKRVGDAISCLPFASTRGVGGIPPGLSDVQPLVALSSPGRRGAGGGRRKALPF